MRRELLTMITEITETRPMCLRIARLKEQGTVGPEQISIEKMNNVSTALDILGANGIIHEYPVIRQILNLETVNTHEDTEEVSCLIVGKEIAPYDASS